MARLYSNHAWQRFVGVTAGSLLLPLSCIDSLSTTCTSNDISGDSVSDEKKLSRSNTILASSAIVVPTSKFAGVGCHNKSSGISVRRNRPNSAPSFVQASFVQDIANHRLVFLGESHSTEPIVDFQRQVQAEMLRKSQQQTEPVSRMEDTDQQGLIARIQATPKKNTAKVHVVMEHFSFEHQGLLNEFLDNGEFEFEDLVRMYQELGEEGHDLTAYKGLLEDAKASNGQIKLHAGFLPRRYARMWINEGPDKTRQAIPRHWLPDDAEDEDDLGEDIMFDGTELHFSVFESFFTGRPVFNQEGMLQFPTTGDQFRGIFQAQVLKDVAMSNKINTLIDGLDTGADKFDEKLLIIAGNGHLKHYCGIPERVLWKNQHLIKDTCLVISEGSTQKENFLNDEAQSTVQKAIARKSIYNPADYIYFYRLSEHDKEESRSQ